MGNNPTYFISFPFSLKSSYFFLVKTSCTCNIFFFQKENREAHADLTQHVAHGGLLAAGSRSQPQPLWLPNSPGNFYRNETRLTQIIREALLRVNSIQTLRKSCWREKKEVLFSFTHLVLITTGFPHFSFSLFKQAGRVQSYTSNLDFCSNHRSRKNPQ